MNNTCAHTRKKVQQQCVHIHIRVHIHVLVPGYYTCTVHTHWLAVLLYMYHRAHVLHVPVPHPQQYRTLYTCTKLVFQVHVLARHVHVDTRYPGTG